VNQTYKTLNLQRLLSIANVRFTDCVVSFMVSIGAMTLYTNTTSGEH